MDPSVWRHNASVKLSSSILEYARIWMKNVIETNCFHLIIIILTFEAAA